MLLVLLKNSVYWGKILCKNLRGFLLDSLVSCRARIVGLCECSIL